MNSTGKIMMDTCQGLFDNDLITYVIYFITHPKYRQISGYCSHTKEPNQDVYVDTPFCVQPANVAVGMSVNNMQYSSSNDI